MSYEDDLLTISEAARRSGKSIMTIRKYLGLTGMPSRLPNARKEVKPGETQETWSIPLSDLYEAGLMKGKVKAAPKEDLEDPEDPLNAYAKLALLQVENQALKEKVEALERNLADLRSEVAFHRRAIETAETQEKRRRFWQR